MDNKDNYSAEALKERGHGVIEESKWENFDKMVDNNCKSWMGLRYVDNVLLLCEIMHNEAMPLADRRRQAYDTFFRRQHNGLTQEDYAEFRDALYGDHYDGEKADQILRERTWKHLGKRY